MRMPRIVGDQDSAFWTWEEDPFTGAMTARLNIDIVVRNAIENMRILGESATTAAVIDYLRVRGYVVIAPEGT